MTQPEQSGMCPLCRGERFVIIGSLAFNAPTARMACPRCGPVHVNAKPDFLHEASGVKESLDERQPNPHHPSSDPDDFYRFERAEDLRLTRINRDHWKRLFETIAEDRNQLNAAVIAERSQRESEGVAYKKEIAELRERATATVAVLEQAQEMFRQGSRLKDEAYALAIRERDEARRDYERLRDQSLEDSEAHLKMMAERDAARAVARDALDGWADATQYKGEYLSERHGDMERIRILREALGEA